MNEQTNKKDKNLVLKNFIQIFVSLFLRAQRVPLAHRGNLLARKMGQSHCGEIQHVNPTEFGNIL